MSLNPLDFGPKKPNSREAGDAATAFFKVALLHLVLKFSRRFVMNQGDETAVPAGALVRLDHQFVDYGGRAGMSCDDFGGRIARRGIFYLAAQRDNASVLNDIDLCVSGARIGE